MLPLLYVFPGRAAAIAGIGIGLIILLVIFSHAPKSGRLENQRSSQAAAEQTGAWAQREIDKVAKRCAYISTPGNFTYADFTKLMREDLTRWVWSDVTTSDYPRLLPVFIEEQCKWPQDFMTRIGALALDVLMREREGEVGFRAANAPEDTSSENAARLNHNWTTHSED
jgi:hypothetical protein